VIGRVVAAGAVGVLVTACAGAHAARTVTAQPTRPTAATTGAATSVRPSGPARGSVAPTSTATTAITLPAVTAKPPTPVSSFPDLGSDAVLTDNRVFMVGDSVLQSAAPGYGNQLRRVLGPLGWRTTIDAVEGRPASGAVDVLRERRGDIGQVVVILIGNNYNGNEPEYGRNLDQMLTLLDGVDKIVMLTVEEYRPMQAEVNAEIRREAARNPRVVLVDWNAVAKTTPGVNRPDGLHLTNIGAGVLAATIADALGPAP
jgi:hypothetical protein